MREQKNFEKGIEYSVNRIKASLEGLSYDALNTDLLKGIVDTGNSAINIVDTLVSGLGTLQTIIIGISGVVGSKKFGLLNYNKQDDKGGILGGLSVGGQGLSGLFTNQNKRMLGKESNQQFLEGLADYWNDGSEAIKTYANSLDGVDAELVDFAQKEQALGHDIEGLNTRFEEAGSVSAKLTGAWKNLGSVAKQAGAMLVNALASMAITTVISLAIKGISSLTHNWEDLAKTTKEYGENYNSSKKTLSDYKDEISDLQNILHDNSSTTEEVATATSRLYEIQSDLVNTYGSYAAGLDLVNGKLETQLGILDDIDKKNAKDAVNQIDAKQTNYVSGFNLLSRLALGLKGGLFGKAFLGFDTGSSFLKNFKTKSIGENLSDTFMGDINGFNPGETLLGSTSYQIGKYMEDFSASTKKIDKSKVDSVKSLVETMDSVNLKDNKLSFSGDVNTVMDESLKLQKVLEGLNTDHELDGVIKDLTEIYNSASEINTNFGEQYNAIITNSVYSNQKLLNTYRDLQEAYNNVQIARENGSNEEIAEANRIYSETINQINNSDIGQQYKNYFNDLYPELQSMVSQWELETKIVPELDDNTKKLLSGNTIEKISLIFDNYQKGKAVVPESVANSFEDLQRAFGDSGFDNMDSFLKSIKGIPEYSDDLLKVKQTLQDIWSNDKINKFIDGLSDTQLQVLMSLDLDEVSKVRTESQLKELIERAQRFSDNNPVKIQVDEVFGKSDALTTALGEQKSQGFLSDETLAGLKSNFADLNEELYTFTENGIMLNTEAMQKFTEQSAKAALVMAEMKETIAVKEYNKEAKVLKSMVSVNNNLKRAYDGGKKSLKDYLSTTKDLTKAQINSINVQLDKVDTLATEINNYDMLEARIRMATSALNEYVAATETPNLSDNFNTAKGAVDALAKSFEDGWTGTDEFRKGMEYIAGYNFDPDIMEWGSGKYAEDWATQVEEYITRAQRYFTEDVSGIYNFLDDAAEKTQGDLQNFISKSAEGVYTIDIENIDAFAQKMDMSVSAVMDMLLATEEAWDFDIDFSNVTDSIVDGLNEIDESTENSRTKLDDFKKSIEALEDAGYDVTDLWETYNEAVERSNPTLSIGIELSEKSKDEVMSEAEALADKVSKDIGDAEISFNLDIEGTNKLIEQVQEYRSGLEAGSSQYEEATTVLAGLLQRKYELEQPAIMQVDTSQLSEEAAGAMTLIQDFYNTVQEYQYQLEIGADTSDVEEKIATLQTNLQGISSTTLSNLGMGSIDFSGDFSKVYDELGKIDADSLVKNNKVKIKADSSDAKNTLDSFLSTVASSSATVKIKSTLSSDFSSTLQSQINASGTYSVSVHSSGSSSPSKSGKHKASGGTVTRSEGDVLVGELGQELVARDGTYFTVGNNGAEMIPLKKGDIVFNAEQTAELLSRHKINSLGQIVGQSYAGGTSARGAGRGFTSGSSGWKKKNTSSSGSGNRSSGGSSNYSSNDSSVADEAEETAETFDWIEVKIQRIEEEIARLDERVENTYELWSNRNQNLKSEIGSVTKEIDIQLAGYKRYLQEANSVGLSETYAKKVREGLIDIETIHNNDELVEKINLYQQWYNKAVECYDQVQTLQIRLGELYETNFEHTKDQYEQILSISESYADLIDERINRTEEKGYFVSKKYYTDLAKYEQTNINNLRKEYDELINKRNEAVKSGYITKDSEAFRNMNKDILDVAKSIEESTTQLVKFNNEMRQIDWDVFDYARDRVENVNTELEFLIDLLDNQKLYDDYGMFNNRGWADAALHASEYNIYMQQALDYANERAKIEKELAKDKYNKTLIERREELIKLQQESIENSYAEKEAVRDLVEAGIDIHLKKLNETIDKYKRAIKDSRDLYDYQKKISEQTQNISNIQKQISAYQGDDSEEIRATIQKLRQNLEDAQTQLKETQWDKYISETETFLSDMYDEYEQVLNARLDNIDLLMSDMIDDINYHGGEIKNVISQVTGEVAYKLTDNANTIINNGTIVSDFKNKFDTYATTTQQALNDIKAYVSSMANKTVSTAVNTAKVDAVPVATGKKVTTTSPNQGVVQTFNNASENSAPNYHTMTKRVDFDAGIYNAVFDVNYYKNRYPDLQKAFGNDYGAYLNHFLTYGMKEGRQASETFDVKYYKSKYGDLQKAFGNNLKAYYEHFLTYGIKEGRQGSATFNAQTYKKLYKDLQNAYGNNLSSYYAHYNRWGAGENRKHYATGTSHASNEIAWTNEGALYGKGGEVIYRKSDGAILTPLHNGDKVFTAQMSDNLWNLAKLNLKPTSAPTGTAVKTVNNVNEISITLPNVSNYDEFKTKLKNDPNMANFIQEITLGEVSTGVKLNKRKL